MAKRQKVKKLPPFAFILFILYSPAVAFFILFARTAEARVVWFDLWLVADERR